jgi:cold shock CspA family protein
VASEMTWAERLKRLQGKLNLTPDGFASELRITTRTLADFMKSEADGGRDPTGPVQRLVELLSGEEVLSKPKLNLVVIHDEFKVPGSNNAVDTIVEMHAAAGKQFDNEYHYVAKEPERNAKLMHDSLVKSHQMRSHFFPRDSFVTEAAMDCYFTATTVWLATQAMRRDLAHITLAADVNKFWPLARELRQLAEVKVTFVQQAESTQSESLISLLQQLDISIADPSGRKFGFISSLKSTADPKGKIDYGFITPGKKVQNGKPTEDGAPLFFSFNHMRKDKNDEFQIEINKLNIGDYVSFSIGMNYKGASATDVVLVERTESSPNPTQSDKAEMLDIYRDAVTDCADKKGWALSADVGSRMKVLSSNYKDRLKTIDSSYTTLQLFGNSYKDTFEYSSDNDQTGHSAACVRIKPKKS